ncbi:MAG: hypothetical protein JJU05_03760 [Verrucomicrobia bacterium]|nr:hypothetical protein [Verrucomicrobiota bacterium]MCH8526478.1 hypothetical protein [Kiritimatiellia bacterium]
MSAYRKIATGSGPGVRTYLYRGSDHLLLVEGSVQEKYRRFFYNDIQAAIFVPNRLHAWALGFFGAAFVAVGIAFHFSMIPEPTWYFVVPGLLVWLRLVYVLMRGGYCTFYLHTAAQYARIRGITTAGKARKIMDLIETMTPQPSEIQS